MDGPVCPSDQVKGPSPTAVRVVGSPAQISTSGLAVTVGAGLMVMVTVSETEHVPLPAVAV